MNQKGKKLRHQFNVHGEEEIIHTIQEHKPFDYYLSMLRWTWPIFPIVFILSTNIAIVLSIGFIALYFSLNQSKRLGVITTKGIRTINTSFIPWKHIDEIKLKTKEGDRYFQIDVTRNYKSNTRLNYGSKNENLNYNHSHEFQNAIIVGSIPPGIELFRQIIAIKEKESLSLDIQDVHNLFKKKYFIKTDNTDESIFLLEGNTNEFQINSRFSKILPFRQFETTIKLQKKLAAHQFISHESFNSLIPSFNSVQLGHPAIDNSYKINCSHPEQLRELFTEENIHNFKLLTSIGAVQWVFGKPFKNNYSKPLVADKIREEERVLDAPFQTSDQLHTEYQSADQAYDTLEFIGAISPKFERDPEKVKKFIALSTELTLLMAEKINSIL